MPTSLKSVFSLSLSLVAGFAIFLATAAHAEFITKAVEEKFEHGVAACLAHIETGVTLDGLKEKGFRGNAKRREVLVKNPNVLGKTNVKATAKRGRCSVTISPAVRKNREQIAALTQAVFLSQGYTIKLRPVNQSISEKVYEKNGMYVDITMKKGTSYGSHFVMIVLEKES